MKCPKCGSTMMSRVYGVSEVGEQVRRNRECTNCGYRFITMEKAIGPVRKYGGLGNGLKGNNKAV